MQRRFPHFHSRRSSAWAALMLSLSLPSCDQDMAAEADPMLVVEGWIDDGGFPIVMLSETVPISSRYQDISSLGQYMIRWGKVTVDNGEREIVLTGRSAADFLPPYVYTTGEMRGEVGKVYTVRVEYGDYEAVARTTILPATPIDSFAVQPSAAGDSTYILMAYFQASSDEHVHYKVFTNVNTPTGMFLTPQQSLLNGRLADGRTEMPIYRSVAVDDTIRTPYFFRNDTVGIKFTTVDDAAYHCWDQFCQSIHFSRSPFFPSTFNIPGNVEGAFGTWFGYGARYYYIAIADLLEE